MSLISHFIMQNYKVYITNYNMPFVTTYYENIDSEKVVWKIHSKLSNIQSVHLSEVYKNKTAILSQKQLKNLLWLLTWARFNTKINAFQQQNRLFKSIDKRWKICSLYIVEWHSFIMFNNMRREVRSHVTCWSINIIYYLKCNMCKKRKPILEKLLVIISLDSNLEWTNTSLIPRVWEDSTCKFPIYVYNCGLKNKMLKQTIFWN